MAGEYHSGLRAKSLAWNKVNKAMEDAKTIYGKDSAEYVTAREEAIDAQLDFVEYASKHVDDLHREFSDAQMKIDELEQAQQREVFERADLDPDLERRVQDDLERNRGDEWER
ncbi:flagellar biosynthesis chaperone FliJ [Actinoplanes lutulentus]|uniref:Uncharacterized protein n=1 Tax=Actinoplanes lutulentus TaxID=1287878 RepID=A0A327Z9Y9_9ACTN|nr:hypothetical protein [Actinoplanes lutulentus]MBB2943281.1 flagellar biosynthesis chaperone FliJ [Actinoplanes lutulentus]RAK28341.1 hypothetical protein B0I29_120109 [Actinoplanes lutulentus]